MTLQGPFEEPEGASPLDADDVAGLIPTWVATRGDLDTVEQENIGKAMTWASSRSGPKSLSSLLTEQMMRDLHRRMFGEVWKWAGSYRKHDTNIGVHWPQITTQVCDLLADVSTQAADGEHLPWPADELALRFHHRLGLIHPFPNGNGRHARLAADLLAEALGRPVFTWGAENLSQAGEVRSTYIDALRRADVSHDYEPLMIFARS